MSWTRKVAMVAKHWNIIPWVWSAMCCFLGGGLSKLSSSKRGFRFFPRKKICPSSHISLITIMGFDYVDRLCFFIFVKSLTEGTLFWVFCPSLAGYMKTSVPVGSRENECNLCRFSLVGYMFVCNFWTSKGVYGFILNMHWLSHNLATEQVTEFQGIIRVCDESDLYLKFSPEYSVFCSFSFKLHRWPIVTANDVAIEIKWVHLYSVIRLDFFLP